MSKKTEDMCPPKDLYTGISLVVRWLGEWLSMQETTQGLIPGQGTKVPHATGQLNLCASTTEPACSGARVPQLKKPMCCI